MVMRKKDYASHVINTITCNENGLPKALPWIEPSINNLYLEACSSFLFGNYLSTIITGSLLLEHTLRLAVVNKNECGLHRSSTIDEIDSYRYLINIINEAKEKNLLSGCNEQWWRDSASYIRNKTAHYLLPKIIRDCSEVDSFKGYIDDTLKKENNSEHHYDQIITDWGAFYHGIDRRFALKFLNDVSHEVSAVIDNTNWVGDESWWISQKNDYIKFFEYVWTYENTLESMSTAQFSLSRSK